MLTKMKSHEKWLSNQKNKAARKQDKIKGNECYGSLLSIFRNDNKKGDDFKSSLQ